MLRASAAAAEPDARVVLIGATDADLDRWGWPLSDEVLARLLERLVDGGARAIGVDLYRDATRPPGEEHLSRVLSAHRHIVGVMKLGEAGERSIPAPAALRGSAQVGFADVVSDPGGTVRRALLYIDDGRTVYSSFALQLALKYLEPQGIKPRPEPDDPALLRLGKTTLAPLESNDGGYVDIDAAGYQFLLDFRGGGTGFRRLSVSEVLDGRVAAEALRDRIAIVGVAAQSVKDYFHVPAGTGEGSGDRAYGIEFHGHAASQLLRMAEGSTAARHSFSERQELAWLALWCALGALAGFAARGAWLAAAAVAGVAAIAAASRAAFGAGWWLPAMPPLAAWLSSVGLLVAARAWLERRSRAQLMQLFSRHVSPEVAATIWTRRAELLDGSRLRPQSLTATVLFSDIKGFTSVSERLEAAALVEWLNAYMERMAGLVMRHGGIVDKYIGDAVMAVFGVPFARRAVEEVARDATNAVDCALAMRTELDAINREHGARGLPPIAIRIGIYTGPLIVGSLGSRERLDYTVIGDTVNTASRLESYSGAGDARLEGESCRILIGESTLRHAPSRYEVWRVGELALKGKERGVTVFGVSGLARPGGSAPREEAP